VKSEILFEAILGLGSGRSEAEGKGSAGIPLPVLVGILPTSLCLAMPPDTVKLEDEPKAPSDVLSDHVDLLRTASSELDRSAVWVDRQHCCELGLEAIAKALA